VIGNNYTLVLIDGSFLLTRALFAVTRGKDPGEVKPGELMKVNLQTINRLGRDWKISGSKVIIVWDKWAPEYGGYIRHHLLRDRLTYKSSRKIVTEDDEAYAEIKLAHTAGLKVADEGKGCELLDFYIENEEGTSQKAEAALLGDKVLVKIDKDSKKIKLKWCCENTYHGGLIENETGTPLAPFEITVE
jgi:5'-3' exonuclease